MKTQQKPMTHKEKSEKDSKKNNEHKLQFEHLSEIVVCNDKDVVVKVARILRDTSSRHLLVLNDKKQPQGVISTVDINNRVVAEEKNPAALKASDIMTKTIVTVPVTVSLPEALDTMASKNISFLPVVDNNGCLAGVLEFANVLKTMAKLEKECQGKMNKTC